jgi:hypothetical protein
MFRSLPRQLTRLAFGLGVLTLLPLTGAVHAQPPSARNAFIPYVLPGQWPPATPNNAPVASFGWPGVTSASPPRSIEVRFDPSQFNLIANRPVPQQIGFNFGGGGFSFGGGGGF